MDSPLVIAQILTFNGLELLKESVKYLFEQDYNNLKIEIIDNGSDDGSIEFIEREYPDVRIIKNEMNLGLAKARNIGFKSAIEQNADYVLSLDNDTFLVNKSIISDLIENINIANINNAFAFSVGLQEGREYNIINDGNILFKKQALKNKHFNKFRHFESKNIEGKNIRFVDFTSGCFMLIDIKSLISVGFVDERYYIYYEETDLCLRAWKRGYSSIIFPELYVQHKKSATNTCWSPFYTYYTIRNFLLLTGEYLNQTTNDAFFRLLRIKKLLSFCVIALVFSIKRFSVFSVMKSISLAVIDFKRKRFYKRY